MHFTVNAQQQRGAARSNKLTNMTYLHIFFLSRIVVYSQRALKSSEFSWWIENMFAQSLTFVV